MNDSFNDLHALIKEVTHLYVKDKRKIAAAIESRSFELANFNEYLEDPAGMPYGRRVLYLDEVMEVILMNWDSNSECLPHNHGCSEGWVKILKGCASHCLYSNRTTAPSLANEERLSEGSVIFSPKRLIHSMANESNDPLVTLHFYFPPISNMEVFDINAMRSAIVTSDCGAWWPESRKQLISCRSMTPTEALRERESNTSD